MMEQAGEVVNEKLSEKSYLSAGPESAISVIQKYWPGQLTGFNNLSAVSAG